MKHLNHIIPFIFLLLIASCGKDGESKNLTTDGQAGSLAKMVTIDNHLYVINSSEMLIYNLNDPLSPAYQNTVDVGFGIETIFPFGSHLFIGSVDGLYVYDKTDPVNPFLVTEEQIQHITACDPVVANEDRAYVTLNTLRSSCGGSVPANVLLTYDISNITDITLLSTTQMAGPKGLGIDDNYLFICDASNGIVIFDITDTEDQPEPIGTIEGFTANDIIVDNNRLMIVCEDGMRQFDYSDINNINLLSFISTDE